MCFCKHPFTKCFTSFTLGVPLPTVGVLCTHMAKPFQLQFPVLSLIPLTLSCFPFPHLAQPRGKNMKSKMVCLVLLWHYPMVLQFFCSPYPSQTLITLVPNQRSVDMLNRATTLILGEECVLLIKGAFSLNVLHFSRCVSQVIH
jgi:hypothetical protein